MIPPSRPIRSDNRRIGVANRDATVRPRDFYSLFAIRSPPMNHFNYIAGELHAEEVPIRTIAAAVGTPFYCYATATLERHYRVFAAPFPKGTLIAFSVKANGNLAVLRTLARLGAGADVVSGGELKKALAAGIPPARIVFSGVGKPKAEMRAGLDAGIHQFNVES